MRGRRPTKEEINMMLESKEPAPKCARKLGFSTPTVVRYRKDNGYKYTHAPGGFVVQADIELANVDKTNPIDKFLYA